MKTVGLLGGMTWHSTVTYYKVLNEAVAAALGRQHSAKVLLHSVDFEEIETRQRSGDWAGTAAILGRAAKGLAGAGADCVLICANTMHKVAEEVQRSAGVPLLHIADAAADALDAAGLRTVGLLGTRYTMEQDFYTARLAARGFTVLVPEEEERARVHDIIFSELGRGIIQDDSRAYFVEVMDKLSQRGAEGIILGCTEIPLLVGQKDTPIPLFDTTVLHAQKAAAFALE